jgi:2'-5' RNA ligase
MTQMLRLFVAIPVSEPAHGAIASLIERGKRKLPLLKWVPPGNIHLSVAFLGDIPEDQLCVVADAIDQACVKQAPLALRLKELGTFGSRRAPRVLWLGIEQDTGVMALQADVAASLRDIDIPLETRPYHPHVTLGRIAPRGPGGDLPKFLGQHEAFDAGTISVTHVQLMQSILQPQGAIHTERYRAMLM